MIFNFNRMIFFLNRLKEKMIPDKIGRKEGYMV